jgi:hypothetical protein
MMGKFSRPGTQETPCLGRFRSRLYQARFLL